MLRGTLLLVFIDVVNDFLMAFVYLEVVALRCNMCVCVWNVAINTPKRI